MNTKVNDTDLLFIYKKAEPSERFGIIYYNYADFPKMIRKIEKKLQYKINAEREYLKSKNKGELGIRVKISNLSDITADTAINNVSLEECIKKGVLDSKILKGIEQAPVYEDYIHTLRMMRMDYDLMAEIIEDLPYKDCELIKEYLIEGKHIRDISKEYKKSYDCIKKRLTNIREDIKEEILECFDMSWG